jgi:hypothetical protein
MKPKHAYLVFLNLVAVFVLLLLLGMPFYFASTITKPANVAGAKSQRPFVVISQVDKFPNIKLLQQDDSYKITFEKIAPSQAFTSLLLITNPTNRAQNYSIIKTAGDAEVFFGEDLENRQTTITAPSSVSIPISIYSAKESSASSQTVDFQVEVK